MNPNIISATEASRSFSEILNRVYYQGSVFDIKRGKEIIAKIIPVTAKPAALKVKDLANFLQHLPTLPVEDRRALSKEINILRKKQPDTGRLWD